MKKLDLVVKEPILNSADSHTKHEECNGARSCHGTLSFHIFFFVDKMLEPVDWNKKHELLE